MLYAQDSWAVLLIFQAMDAAGKDGAIKHVMSGINPQGCQVASFKAPSPRSRITTTSGACQKRLPERGHIGIFNRFLLRESASGARASRASRQAEAAVDPGQQEDLGPALRDICAFERYLTRNGIAIRKFFLHISHAEQKRRFLERLDTPEKNWKFSAADIAERRYWREYMAAYQT